MTKFTDEQVEQEIERLLKSPHVAMSRKAERLRNKRRQFMYSLRWHEKKGKKMEAEGVTPELLMALEELCG